jgi:hypothetical protein
MNGEGTEVSKVWCKYCVKYPERNRQPGTGMCVSPASNRSPDSRPCEPQLTLAGRIRKLLGRPIG